MKVYDLVNSCQNQWKDFTFNRNEDFRLEITKGNTTYIFSAIYCEIDDWIKVRDLDVGYWSMKYDDEHKDYTLRIRVSA